MFDSEAEKRTPRGAPCPIKGTPGGFEYRHIGIP